MKHNDPLTDFLVNASDYREIEPFLELAFPPEWAGVRARIIESGAQFVQTPVPWAARWSMIPWTMKRAPDGRHGMLKSIIYRVHDCLHQLWGLPHPSLQYTADEFSYFKRVAMCGEVAVLTLTEFEYCNWLREQFSSEELYAWLDMRNAIPLLDGPLRMLTLKQIAARLDGVLHRNFDPAWVRENPAAQAFVNDYRPMLERDRRINDNNWGCMFRAGWLPKHAPQSRALKELDGLELTQWMIEDFEHLLSTTSVIDWDLVSFNRERRSKLVFPEGWVMSK